MQCSFNRLPHAAALILLGSFPACSSDLETPAETNGTADNGVSSSPAPDPDTASSPDRMVPDGGASAEVTSESALAAFWNAFHQQRYEEIDSVLAQLAAAAESSPADARLPLLSALSHLWWTVEWPRDPTRDPREIGARSGATIQSLMKAQALAPDDLRIPCWLGVTLMNAGRATEDAEMIAQGEAVLEQGVEAFPEFNLFCKMLAYSQEPRHTPDFRKSVDALWQLLDTCWEEPVNREEPDITQYLVLEAHTGPKRACWNPGDAAPHNLEGFLLVAGDVLTKAGDLEPAQVLYENIREVPQFDTWPFAERVEGRLADLGARATLYADDDPSNDPAVGPAVDRCSTCHAKGAP